MDLASAGRLVRRCRLAYWGARVGTGQRERQGRREEWGRRFTGALEAVRSEDMRSRMLGRILLAELALSELASAEERDLAAALLNAEARGEPAGADLRMFQPGPALDAISFQEDDDED